jgi:N-[(2S)-2-amino-2-carboxyethyl]-L-glutamate dehydrogenase
MLYLSHADVVRAGGTNIVTYIEAVEEAFRLKQAGAVACPPKIELRWPDENAPVERAGRVMVMPAYVGGRFNVAGVKWISSVPSNPRERDLPRANALIILSSRQTGLPLAVLDGTLISVMRTAAVTALVVRHCASAQARVVALLGAGAVGETQLLGLRETAPHISELVVYDPHAEKARCLVSEARLRGWNASVADDGGEAVRSADIVVVATTACGPSLNPSDLRPGVTVCLVSRLDAPTSLHEVTDRLIVDDWQHETQHHGRYVNRLLGEGLIANAHDVLELGALIAGAARARTSTRDRVVASTVGLGIEDVAAAKTILDKAAAVATACPNSQPAWADHELERLEVTGDT